MKEYIEREAIHKEFDCRTVEVGGELYVNLYDVGIHLRSIPAADVVERKRGEWETTPTYVFSRDGAVLNRHTHRECGYHYRDYLNHGANFCPNCGADMREVDHDNN